jgi:hypothetical protein
VFSDARGYDPSMPRRATVVFFALVAAATTIPVAAVPAPAETTRPGVQVKLLDAGAAPRGLLRLRPVTTPQSVVLTFSTEETQSGISSLHIGPLVIQTVVSLAPSSTATNGTIRMPYTYGAFRLLDSSAGSPQELMALRDALSTFQGFGGQLELSPTGAVISNSFSIPPPVNSQVRNLLQQLSGQSDQLGVPLPSQPVGIGARWRATTHLFVSGISLTQTYEYTLRSRDGTRLTIDARYTQTAASQRASLPNTPPGMTVSIAAYRITGSGSTVADLSRVAAVTGHIAAQGLQRFRVQQGGRSGTINQQVKLTVDLAAG